MARSSEIRSVDRGTKMEGARKDKKHFSNDIARRQLYSSDFVLYVGSELVDSTATQFFSCCSFQIGIPLFSGENYKNGISNNTFYIFAIANIVFLKIGLQTSTT